MSAARELVNAQRKKMMEQGQKPSDEEMMETMLAMQQTTMNMSRGGTFVQQLPADSDWHYAGKGVKLGDANTAIFCYRPESSQTYRVIYGDLSVKDVAAENLPNQPIEDK